MCVHGYVCACFVCTCVYLCMYVLAHVCALWMCLCPQAHVCGLECVCVHTCVFEHV